MRNFLFIAILSLASCDRKPTEKDLANSSELRASDQTTITAQDLPESFEALLSGIIEAMPEERKVEIRKAETAEAMVDHFGMGMALRNGELNQRGSEVVNYLTRMGVFHRDDFSSIILLSVNRRLRGEPIDLKAQIQHCRNYWAEQGIVAPLDGACPSCGKEMEIIHIGSGVSDAHPDKVYFLGRCPSEHSFLYYHADGWKLEESIWSGPKSRSEQVVPSDEHKPSSHSSSTDPTAPADAH
ncbi:MAG: hypothetical protein NTW21_31645 [Verrucomicrobia bacterium]|nr:hypothetical protein [Verrucomicrobiota bacterium]